MDPPGLAKGLSSGVTMWVSDSKALLPREPPEEGGYSALQLVVALVLVLLVPDVRPDHVLV